MAVLEFKRYHVTEQSYKRNEHFEKSDNGIDINPKFAFNIKNNARDNSFIVNLGITIGSSSDNSVPFEVIVRVSGKFVYRIEDDTENVGADTLIRKNAVAILYPYVRSLVSSLTNSSNEYPAVTLPTIDVAQVLEEQANS